MQYTGSRFKDTDELNVKNRSCKQHEKKPGVDPQMLDKKEFRKKKETKEKKSLTEDNK